MTLREMRGLTNYWRDVPPLDVTAARLAAFVGLPPLEPEQPKPAQRQRPMTFDEMKAMADVLNAGVRH